VSKKSKLLERLQQRPKDFTWEEACTLMRQCGFALVKNRGSARMFRHPRTGQKVRLHEPHPENTLKRYALDDLIEALTNAQEI
jgi:predicted RNA binding protein YcfA (HicA-like mRNA interferase family)